MPFVALQPGPTTNTLGKFDGKQLITISGIGQDLPGEGPAAADHGVRAADAFAVLGGGLWLSSHNAVVPEELVNPSGQSQQQQNQQGQHDMQASQETPPPRRCTT